MRCDLQLHRCKNPKMLKLCVATFTPIAEMTIFPNLYRFLHSTAAKSRTKCHPRRKLPCKVIGTV